MAHTPTRAKHRTKPKMSRNRTIRKNMNSLLPGLARLISEAGPAILGLRLVSLFWVTQDREPASEPATLAGFLFQVTLEKIG